MTFRLQLHTYVRNAVILCLHAVEVRHTAPSVDSMHLSSFLVSSTPRLIFIQCFSCLWLELRSCFSPQTAQALSQVSDRPGRVSSLRSCFDFKPRFAALRSVMRQLEEWDVYRESSASCILVIRLVIHEISYIQPIHWWNFRFTFWQHMPISSSSLGSSVRPQHSSQSWSPNLHARDGNFSYDKEWSTLPPLRNLLKIRCIPGVA